MELGAILRPGCSVSCWLFFVEVLIITDPNPSPHRAELLCVLAHGFVWFGRGTVGILIASGHTWRRFLLMLKSYCHGVGGILFMGFWSRNVARACFFFAVYSLV